MYPNRSTAMAAAAGSLWYQQQYQGTLQTCATQGLTFAKQLQARITANLNGQTTGPFLNGQTLTVNNVPTSGLIDQQTLAGLWIVGSALSLPTAWLQAIVNDLQVQPGYTSAQSGVGGSLSFATMQAALFVGGSHPGDPVGNQTVPADIIPFTYGMVPPDDSASFFAGQIVCWNAQGQPPANLASQAQAQGVAPAGASSVTTQPGGNSMQLVQTAPLPNKSHKFWTEMIVGGIVLGGLGLALVKMGGGKARRRR